jgi:hypothetical protein
MRTPRIAWLPFLAIAGAIILTAPLMAQAPVASLESAANVDGPEGSVLDNTYVPPPIEGEHGGSF